MSVSLMNVVPKNCGSPTPTFVTTTLLQHFFGLFIYLFRRFAKDLAINIRGKQSFLCATRRPDLLR